MLVVIWDVVSERPDEVLWAEFGYYFALEFVILRSKLNLSIVILNESVLSERWPTDVSGGITQKVFF